MPPKKFKVREPEAEPPKVEEPKPKRVFKTPQLRAKKEESALKIQGFLKRAIEKRKAKKVVTEERKKLLIKNYKETNKIFTAFANAYKIADKFDRTRTINSSVLEKYRKDNSYHPMNTSFVPYNDAMGLAIYQEFLEQIEKEKLGERGEDFAEFWFHQFTSSYGRMMSDALVDISGIMKGIRNAVTRYGTKKPNKFFREERVEPPYGPDISRDSLNRLSDIIEGFTLEFDDEIDLGLDDEEDELEDQPYDLYYYVSVE